MKKSFLIPAAGFLFFFCGVPQGNCFPASDYEKYLIVYENGKRVADQSINFDSMFSPLPDRRGKIFGGVRKCQEGICWVADTINEIILMQSDPAIPFPEMEWYEGGHGKPFGLMENIEKLEKYGEEVKQKAKYSLEIDFSKYESISNIFKVDIKTGVIRQVKEEEINGVSDEEYIKKIRNDPEERFQPFAFGRYLALFLACAGIGGARIAVAVKRKRSSGNGKKKNRQKATKAHEGA